MRQEIFLIYSKTDLRAVHQYNSPNIIEAYKNFQTFVQNQVQQNSKFMPVRFSDYVLLNVGSIDPDFLTNDNHPLLSYDNYTVVTKTLVENYIKALEQDKKVDLSVLGAQIYDFEKELQKRIDQSNTKGEN